MAFYERRVLSSEVAERTRVVRVVFQLECGHELLYDVPAGTSSRLWIRKTYRARKRADRIAKRATCPCPACGPVPKVAAL